MRGIPGEVTVEVVGNSFAQPAFVTDGVRFCAKR